MEQKLNLNGIYLAKPSIKEEIKILAFLYH